MSRPQPRPAGGAGRLQVDYVADGTPAALLADPDVLAVLGFGSKAPQHDDPRYLRVPLDPFGSSPLEVWRATGPVNHGRDGAVAWACDGNLCFGAIEVAEAEDGIAGAARRGYDTLMRFVGASHAPHLLRIWNYMDAITLGEGDNERYRQFCTGRAAGLGRFDTGRLPAATAIGRCDGQRVLQIYWLSARRPGTPVENPRQISAYRYPRQYGPQPPSFARAMLPPDALEMPLLLSGTAAIVGHASREGGIQPQLEETLRNFDALLDTARGMRPELPPHFDSSTRLKVYVRDRDDLPRMAQALDQHLGKAVPRILLHAAICRRELAVEIDGVHG